MALNPIPYVVVDEGEVGDAPSGAVPIALYGVDAGTPPTPEPVDPVVLALIDAGFGSAGQVLATNSTGDGFEWVDLD